MPERVKSKPEVSLPAAKTHFENWAEVPFAGPFRALILSDVHIPYHSRKAVQAAVKHGQARKCNFVLLNGDMMDFYAISRWEKDPRKRRFKDEINAGRRFFKWIRAQFPKARIVLKEGNHEERWEAYLMQKAPELLGLPDFKLESILRLDDCGIEVVRESRPVVLGKLFVIHGHEYRFAISNPVNPARGLFLKAKVSAMCGHFHQTSQHTETRLDRHVIGTLSTGCLCDMRYDYGPINNHNHGFAVVEVAADGTYNPTNHRIIHGKVY